MARISSFLPGTQNVSEHKTYVDCYLQVVEAGQGERLVHISTFGSPDREGPPKSSQAIQLSEADAAHLSEFFLQTWPQKAIQSARTLDNK